MACALTSYLCADLQERADRHPSFPDHSRRLTEQRILPRNVSGTEYTTSVSIYNEYDAVGHLTAVSDPTDLKAYG